MDKRKEYFIKGIRFILCMIIVTALVLPFPSESSAAAKFNPKTKVKSVTVENASFQKVKLTWKKTPGATGYQIYRSTSKNGKYKKIATTSKRTITNRGILGKTYYYKIRAYKKQGLRLRYTKWSTPKKITSRLNRPTIKIKRSLKYGEGERNKVSWKKISGATRYEVYKSDSANGKYTKLATTKNLYVIDKDVKVSKTYYYKVRARRTVNGKRYYSYYSKQPKHDWEKTSISIGLVECRAHYVDEGKPMFFTTVEDQHLHQANRECTTSWGEGFHYAACKRCTKCNQVKMIDHVHDFDTVAMQVYFRKVVCECGISFHGGESYYDRYLLRKGKCYDALTYWEDHSYGYSLDESYSQHDTYTYSTDSWATYFEARKTCSCSWRPVDDSLTELRKMVKNGYVEIYDVKIDGVGGYDL